MSDLKWRWYLFISSGLWFCSNHFLSSFSLSSCVCVCVCAYAQSAVWYFVRSLTVPRVVAFSSMVTCLLQVKTCCRKSSKDVSSYSMDNIPNVLTVRFLCSPAVPAHKSSPASAASCSSFDSRPGSIRAKGFTRAGPPPQPSLSDSPQTEDNRLGESRYASKLKWK